MEKLSKQEPPKEEHELKDRVKANFWLYDLLDLDKASIFRFFALLRVLQCLFMSRNHVYADEYWQGTEVAYDIVYGGVSLPWEWCNAYRLRNVIYPSYLSIPL